MELEKKEAPKVVSLVALGASKTDFFNECMTTGNPRGLSDEVWVINKMGVVIKHDMLFRMDDLSITYDCNNKHYKGGTINEKKSVHATYDEFLRNHDKPIVTSKAYDDYPTSVEYPLEKVVNLFGRAYFRTTPAYAAAFALMIGVKQLRVYGCDYVYSTNKFQAEMGRANLESVLTVCMERGMDVWVAPKSSLFDTNLPDDEMMYGYKYPMDIIPDPEDETRYKVISRPEVYENRNKAKMKDEQFELQKLMSKYRDYVKHDLIDGKWITKEDIDRHFEGKNDST
jgi:hypothetical protein